MPKYLVTATAFKRSEENGEAHSPRTFTFEVALDQPWSGKNSQSLGDVAFDECHRAFGFWPGQNPQIDSVVETGGLLPDALSSRLAAAALMDDDEVNDLLQDLAYWDAVNRGAVANTKTQEPEADAADGEFDDLI